MDAQILKVVGQVAGIGGVALGVFLLLFRDVIRKKIFPTLTNEQAFKLLRLILILVWSVALAGIAAWVWVTTTSHNQPATTEMSNDVEINFDGPSTPAKTGYLPAYGYLSSQGLKVIDETSGTQLVLFRASGQYGGLSFAAASEPNVLTQINCNGRDETFTVRFDKPVRSVKFVRPRLLSGTPSGITHPAWTASALDAGGHTLSTVGEELIKQFGSREEARSFMLEGGEIVAVRFTSDYRDETGRPFAAFCGVLIDNMVLSRSRS